MGRAPCCEKVGLRKGPWSLEEDQRLVAYVQKHGPGHWRVLPTRAGLLRCGKSCRLRWLNYLRPDIKRGNFTKEEEDAIINMHAMLGNRWSAIATWLPGRTDNEIKNVWHAHLKKRVNNLNKTLQCSKRKSKSKSMAVMENNNNNNNNMSPSMDLSSQMNHMSSSSVASPRRTMMDNTKAMTMTTTTIVSDHSDISVGDPLECYSPTNGDDLNFWLAVFMQSANLPELPNL